MQAGSANVPAVKNISLFVVVLALATPVVAAPPAPPAAAKADPGDEPLPLWSAVKKGRLPNGLTYYVLPHGKPEKRALLWLAVNAGSVLEDDDQRGLAHFDEHMAFNGTKRFPKADIINRLEKMGMEFGADLNAYTTFDETVYQLEVPSDDEALVGQGLDILRDWAGSVSFDAVEVEKERGVVLEEWRLGSGAAQRIFDKQAPLLFKGSRYADRLTIGLPEIIQHAPREALTRFYKDWYRPDLMAVIAVGDFDAAKIEAAISARFADLENPKVKRARVRAAVPVPAGTRVSIEADAEAAGASVSVYNVVAHRGEASLNDFKRLVTGSLYEAILNERLRTISRRKDAAFVGAGVGIQGLTREIDAFARSAQPKAGKLNETLESLLTEVARVEKFGFLPGELERGRAVTERFIAQAAAEQETVNGRDYTSEITRNFFEGELMIGRTRETELTQRFLPTITLDDLNALTRSFGGPESRVILIEGPDKKALPDEASVLALVDKVARAAATLEPWTERATPTLPAAPPAGRITAEKRIEAINVTEWTLSNGARVIVKPTDFEADAVSLSALSPGGLAMASDKAFATARFANDIVGVGGAGDLDAEDLDRVLAGKKVGVSTFIGATTEGVSAGGSAKDLPLLLQLVNLGLTSPRLDENAVGVWQANTAFALQNSLAIPEVRTMRLIQKTLYCDNIRAQPPGPEDVAKAKAADALGFFKDRFGDVSDFTFVIVGAVDLKTLRPAVETWLASLPGKGRHEKEKDLKVRRVKGVVSKQWPVGAADKSQVQLTFHGDETWSRDKDRDMYILGQVLSIRLREVLREDLGGVYGVGAGGSISRSPHEERAFDVEFGCSPANVEKLIQATLTEITAVETNGIGADILDKVKQQFLRQRETALRTNRVWDQWLTTSYRYGDDPTIILDPAPMVARMTSDNVKAAAKRFLDRKQFFQAVSVPEGAANPGVKPKAP